MTDDDALIARLEDLIVQATRERSHYYVASVARKAADALAALTAERDALRNELQNVVNAKRFDKEYFDDDTSFADWAQSRARAALAAQEKKG